MPREAIPAIIAAEIACRAEQVTATIALLDDGATVPFIARYRKEATGGLDDIQLRTLDERLTYLRDLETRREAVIKSVSEQGKLTQDLEAKFLKVTTKAELEDLYLPFRPKRRTRAEIARENGLGPLAERILADRSVDPAVIAAAYLGEKVADVKAALDGARDIIAETFAENAVTVGQLREHMRKVGVLRAKVVAGKETEGAKFSDYFDHAEAWSKAPSHRVLAMLRARNEGVVTVDLEVDADDPALVKRSETIVAETNGVMPGGKANEFLAAAA
ncbi:MAG: Tex-like N-terminal domain-containing protein, partial [Phreatobacter sp.]